MLIVGRPTVTQHRAYVGELWSRGDSCSDAGSATRSTVPPDRQPPLARSRHTAAAGNSAPASARFGVRRSIPGRPAAYNALRVPAPGHLGNVFADSA